MNIYEFLNSRDVAEYCRSINKTWNTFEMAVIIARSNRPIADKHAAWRELIADYPDMPTPKYKWYEGFPSLFKELEKLITHEERVLELFKTPEPGAVYRYVACDSVDFSRPDYKPYECLKPFSTFEKAWEDVLGNKTAAEEMRLKGFSDEDEWYSMIIVEKRYIDNHELIKAFFNCEGNLYHLINYTENEEISKIGRSLWLEYFEVDIPVPFKKGDVLTINSFWYGKEEFVLVLESVKDNATSVGQRLVGFNVNDEGEIYKSCGVGFAYSGRYDYDRITDGDYEYFRGKYKEKEHILHYISLFMQDKICLTELMDIRVRIEAEKQFESSRSVNDILRYKPAHLLAENRLNKEQTEQIRNGTALAPWVDKLTLEQVEFLAAENNFSIEDLQMNLCGGGWVYGRMCAHIVHLENYHERIYDRKFNPDRRAMAKSVLESYGTSENNWKDKYIGGKYAKKEQEMNEQQEGLFWVICSMSDDSIDWSGDWELYHIFVPSDAMSHKDAWAEIARRDEKRFRQVEYNHYPRGRVVVQNGRATVYLNQHIVVEEVIKAINKTFKLRRTKIHAEGGKHYECYIDRI
jgi:hypothetical protein